MPIMQKRNALDNPAFRFWDYTSVAVNLDSLPANGYLANRWKLSHTGWSGNVSKGTTPSVASIPKWLRGRDSFAFSLTGAGTALSMKQTVEDAQTYARSFAVLTVYAFGPDGGSFEIGVAGQFKRVGTKGPDVVVRHDFPVMLQDLALTTMEVEAFRNPSGTGTYRVVFAHLTMGEISGKSGPLLYPQVDADRKRCDRYAQSVGQGITARATSATRMVAGVHLSESMRAGASLLGAATSVNTARLADNASATTASASLTYASGGARGGRLVMDGFTGLTVGESYQITTPSVGVLHADY